jgi:hypothetical protein
VKRRGDRFRKRWSAPSHGAAGASPAARSANRNVFFAGKSRKKWRKTAGRRKRARVPATCTT